MSFLKKFVNANIVGGFNFFPGQGDNQTARLKNLNSLVDSLNSTVFGNYSALEVYRITENLGVAPLTLSKFTSIGVSPGDCNCVSGTDFDRCTQNGKTGEKCSDTSMSASRIAPGVYDFILAPENPNSFSGFSLSFGPVKELGVIINMEIISPTQYRVTAFDTITGLPMDNVLTNTDVQVRIWG
jgi:hypothetical protein